MSCYIDKFNNIQNLNQNDIYKINNGYLNVCFITSCRGISLSIFLEKLCQEISYLKNWQIGISVIVTYIVQQKFSRPTQNMALAIQNADILICECIKNYTYINTLRQCEQNIFNNFNIKPLAKIIMIPNLSIVYYINDIKVLYKDIFNNLKDSDIIELKKKNLDNLIYWCKYYDFNIVANYIETSINTKRLFHTHNHPKTELLIILFKELCEKAFNFHVADNNNLELVKILDFYDNDKTLLTDLDYKLGLNVDVI